MLRVTSWSALLVLLTACNLLLDNQAGVLPLDGGSSGAEDGGIASDTGASSGSPPLDGSSSGGDVDGSVDADGGSFSLIVSRDGRTLPLLTIDASHYQLTVPGSPIDDDVRVSLSSSTASSVRYELDGQPLETTEGSTVIGAQQLAVQGPRSLSVEYQLGDVTKHVEVRMEVLQLQTTELSLGVDDTRLSPASSSVAVDATGSHVAIGVADTSDASGSAYLFTRMGLGSWTPRALPGASAGSKFGSSVTFNPGGELFVGAPGRNTVFRESGGTWTGGAGFGAVLAADLAVFTRAGQDLVRLAASGAETALADVDFLPNAAPMLATAGQWVIAGPVTSHQLLVLDNDTGNSTRLSTLAGVRTASLAMNETVLAVGIPGTDSVDGLVETFRFNDARAWTHAQTTYMSAAKSFGRSLALCGTMLVVGAPEEKKVFVFRVRPDLTLEHKRTFTPPPTTLSYGASVACSLGTIAISASRTGGPLVPKEWVDFVE